MNLETGDEMDRPMGHRAAAEAAEWHNHYSWMLEGMDFVRSCAEVWVVRACPAALPSGRLKKTVVCGACLVRCGLSRDPNRVAGLDHVHFLGFCFVLWDSSCCLRGHKKVISRRKPPSSRGICLVMCRPGHAGTVRRTVIGQLTMTEVQRHMVLCHNSA